MKCYHMTTLDRLESINKLGLVPRNERNSKLVNDDKKKVFFSEGFEGAIALYVDFYIVFNNIKQKKVILDDKKLNDFVIESNSLEEYLGSGIYLCFDMGDIKNERNFENGCTSNIIDSKKLKVLMLKDRETNKILYGRFDLVHYMMAKVNPKEIKYYGANYLGSPSSIAATNRIQNKVISYYDENYDKIKKYDNEIYQLIEVSLSEFLEKYL